VHREDGRAAVAKRWMHSLISSTEIHSRYFNSSVAKLAADDGSRLMIECSLCRVQFLGWQPTSHWTNPFGELEVAPLSIAMS